MAIIRWTPINEVTSLTNAINRLFADSFGMADSPTLPGRGLPINMKETEDSIVVETALPGVAAEDVEISISDNILTIKGDTRKQDEKKEDDYICRECYQGSFYRQVSLPAAVLAEDAEANSENGILTISIPKAPEAKPKTIMVKSKSK